MTDSADLIVDQDAARIAILNWANMLGRPIQMSIELLVAGGNVSFAVEVPVTAEIESCAISSPCSWNAHALQCQRSVVVV